MVFTGKSSDLSASDFNKLKKDAIKFYKNDIEEEKILFVDSKIQLFLNKCLELKTSEKIDAFFENLEKEGNNFESAENSWFIKSKRDIDKFSIKMEEKSDFRSVNIAIEKFAQKVNYLSLKGLLENIKNEYENYKNRIVGPLNTAKENVKDPEKLEYEISKKLEEVNKFYASMEEKINKIKTEYMSSEGIISKESDSKVVEYKKNLKSINCYQKVK
ncbi:hypothetical protein [Brachyspira sp.]|uniref:hypothetical protein n=1 Tax=Brachyspira sp. TaxID=1977261 RepID=UPI003D7D90FB